MTPFLSSFTNKVDRKGRVSVPAPFRNILSGQGFSGVYLSLSLKSPAIDAYGLERMAQIGEQLDQLPEFSDEHEALSILFSSVRQLPFDPEGRIIVPQDLLDAADITETVTFAGRNRMFQLWEPEAFRLHEAEMRGKAKGLSLPPRLPAVAR